MKKNNKVNPLTHFNNLKADAIKKASGEMDNYKKSLKKAQDGIETNDMMINKPGSTGGYKKPMKKYKPWEGPVELIQPKLYNDPLNFDHPKNIGVRALNAIPPKKKGGAVKRKRK